MDAISQVNPDELSAEASLIDECAVAICITDLERAVLEPLLQKCKAVTIPPVVNQVSMLEESLAGCVDAASLLVAAGTDRREFQSEEFRQPLPNPDIRKAKEVRNIDLLFVSSNHAPNVNSYLWFYNEVYLRYLNDCSLVVAGTICYADYHGKSLPGWENPKVLMAGKVKSLSPLYASTKLVLLPIKEGAGIAIKTLEALSLYKPVVATSWSLRGIQSSTSFPTFDEAKPFAKRVLELVKNPEDRLRAAQHASAFIDEEHSKERYEWRMSEALGLAIGRSLRMPKRRRKSTTIKLVELTELTRSANVLIMDWANSRTFDQAAYLALHANITPADLETIRQLFLAVLRDRSAPLWQHACEIASNFDPTQNQSISLIVFVKIVFSWGRNWTRRMTPLIPVF